MQSSIGWRRRCVFAALDLLTAAGVLVLLSVIWSRSTCFTIVSALLVALLLGSAVGVWVDRAWGRWLARLASYYQLILLLLAIFAILFGASYLWGMYGNVGTGAALIFLLIGAVLIELLGLLPIFKLRALGLCERPERLPKFLRMAVLLALALAVVLSLSVRSAVALDDYEPLDATARRTMLKTLAESIHASPHPPGQPPGTKTRGDLYVLRLMARGKTLVRLQARGTPEQATAGLIHKLRAAEWDRGRQPHLVVDRVVAQGPVLDLPLLFALSAVPGLDGMGGSVDGEEVVLLPQEMVIRGLLIKETPIAFVPDFKIGVRRGDVTNSLCRIAKKPPDCAVEGLHRLRTESWLWHPEKGAVPLVRGRPPRPKVDRAAAMQAARAGGDYAVRSLGADNRFAYKYEPVSGKTVGGYYSLVRHCGTAWFLSQLYVKTQDNRYLEGAERGLEFIASKLKPCGPDRLCAAPRFIVKLGLQALALVAFVEQARVSGSDRWMPQIRGLSNMVLAFQKSNGDFHHIWNLKTNQPMKSQGFYMSGQAALALSMLADLTGEQKYTQAVRKIMDYLAGPYWDFFLGNFFFIEEHWTCLAAREAWKLFKDPRHARICVDIGRFYRHLQHPEDAAFPDYVGGVGFTALFPPHTTPTASRTEAMVAAYQLAQQIGEEAEDLREGIRQAIGFMLHNQYRAEDAYLLNDPQHALGGFAWNFLQPTIRIDTVQHACAAILLGAELLPD